ncbi:28S ribosomal protein S18a, mitochondrial-like [Portunus trituberculatus]|uniref:28S ribosomal protein S18a, mitochondrial-like n=1 Tax=Portunus trituberculatus TaxID=210409 RepID=UPI001E1CDFC1|nr:28S ribosomal protein S18a, mitochondrial-like [Portunus trituberculatus]
MMLCRTIRTFFPRGLPTITPVTPAATLLRPLHTTHARPLKEIVVEEEAGGDTVVRGQYLPSPKSSLLLKPDREAGKACPLCALDLDVKHTDVLILSQFMREDGSVLPRRVTGLCGKQQRRLTWLVIMAQKAGLMPNLAPATSKRDPSKRQRSKKFNRYFDESTLPQ